MRPAEFNYGLLKFRDQNVNGSMLLGRDFFEGPAIRKGGVYSDCLMKNWRRYMIRMGHVTHAHPGAYSLVPMFTPISGSAKSPRSE